MSRPLFINGMGHFHPDNVIDNAFLEGLDIGTSDEWILERVGIRKRRTVLPLEYISETRNKDVRAGQEAALHSNVDTGKRAALHAMARAGIGPGDVGLVIAGGCSPEMAIPAEACRIASALEIEAPAFDLNSACSSFGAQLHMLATMTSTAPYVLVVNPENTTRVIDYGDRSTAVLWGDGTSAAVVSKEVPSRVRVVFTTFESSPAGHHNVVIPNGGHFTQEGSTVQRFAIKTTLRCIRAMLPEARERVERTGGTMRFVGHQANLTMLQSVARRAQILGQHHWHNVVEYGNTGASGAPTVLSQHWDDLQDGDTVLMAVVGSGLSWSSLRFDIGEPS